MLRLFVNTLLVYALAVSILLKLGRSIVVVSILAGILGALSILGIRSTSILEPLELTVYDWLIQSRRGAEGADPRIVLITVTEQDILRQGRWPITDAILAEALERLAQSQPRAIGLDIYRDIPVDPGHTELNRVLVEHPQIITVTKLGGGTVAWLPAMCWLLKGCDWRCRGDLIPRRRGCCGR